MGYSGPMTHREYRTQRIWLDEQWNEPSRTDHYLIQIAAYVCYVLSKKSKINLSDFKLTFGIKDPAVRPQITKQKAAKRAKSRWLPFFKGLVREVKED